MKCALGILRRTRELNETLHGLPEPIAVHVGVNSGLATVGATKIEGANGTRWTYTASGQVTIVAARLAALARGDEVLVGAATRERLGDGVLVRRPRRADPRGTSRRRCRCSGWRCPQPFPRATA